MGPIFKRRGGSSLSMSHGFNFAALLTKFSGEFGSFFHDFSATSGPRSSHDRVTIGLRSWSEVFADHLSIGGGRFRSDPAPFSPRSRLDRAAIVEFFHDVQPPSDSDFAGWTIAII